MSKVLSGKKWMKKRQSEVRFSSHPGACCILFSICPLASFLNSQDPRKKKASSVCWANIDHLNQEMPTRKKRMFLFITTTWTVGERSKDSLTKSFLCRYRFEENEETFFSTLWWKKAPHRRKGSRKAFSTFYYQSLYFLLLFFNGMTVLY